LDCERAFGDPLDLACPGCRTPLTFVDGDALRCAACGVIYRRIDGIWHFLAAGRKELFRTFVAHYETVRLAEGRDVRDPEQLRALPFRDLSRRRSYEWRIRSRSLASLLRHVVLPAERRQSSPLEILDLGSGVGWLAYRLASRGHQVAAVDLLTNDFDGLGVHRYYDRSFVSVQAEYDRLPFADEAFDLAIFNAAFHYASDYAVTLREALRVLAPRGRVVIMDSPLYRDPSSGAAMVREREDAFEREYGFRGDGIDAEGFLTYERLAVLQRALDVDWEMVEPWYGVRWWLKPHVARLRGSREPARFKLIIGRRLGDA
jgi:LSD1 subclass zinc finger protein